MASVSDCFRGVIWEKRGAVQVIGAEIIESSRCVGACDPTLDPSPLRGRVHIGHFYHDVIPAQAGISL